MESLSEIQNWLLFEGRRILADSACLRETKLTAAQRVALSQQQQYRKRSRTRFPVPEKWLWSDRSLSQASDWLSACFKASLIPAGGLVVDGCCGAGADAVALAHGRHVRAVDFEPWMVALTKSNAKSHGLEVSGIIAPFDGKALQDADWLHVDPDRRMSSRKTLDDTAFSPSLIDILKHAELVSGTLVKIAPTTRFSEQSKKVLGQGWVRVWLGNRGECRQQVLVHGDTIVDRLLERMSINGSVRNGTGWPKSVAVLLAHSDSADRQFEADYFCGPTGSEPPTISATANQVGPYVYDLDSTLFAANLHSVWALGNNLLPISGEFGYYTAGHLRQSPWASVYEVIDILAWDDRSVRKWLKANAVGQVEVKCRLIKFEAIGYQTRFSKSQGQPISMLVTRIGPKVRCLVCRRIVRTKESCCP